MLIDKGRLYCRSLYQPFVIVKTDTLVLLFMSRDINFALKIKATVKLKNC